MKKILLVSPPFSGHLNVFKSLIRQLGQDFEFSLLITGWTNVTPDLSGIEIPVTVLAKSELHLAAPILWTLPRVAGLVDDCIEFISDLKPNLVIYDFFSLEAVIAAREIGVPYWSSIPAFIGKNNSTYLKEKLTSPENESALEKLKGRLSPDELETVSDGMHLSGQRNLLWSYPALIPKDFAEGRKGEYKFIGNLNSVKEPLSTTRQPNHIYLSFGTVVMGNLWENEILIRERLKTFFSKLASLWNEKPYSVTIVTRGRDLLTSYPVNWLCVDHADQMEELSKASVFVTHAGSNSFHESVRSGVPMVAVPFFGDQPLAAEQIQKLGIGINTASGKTLDTSDSYLVLDEQLAERVETAMSEIFANYEKYISNITSLSLECEDIGNLLQEV